MSEPKVVLFGASGYTGKMIAGQLAARGIPFVAAGRNAERLRSELGNNPNWPAPVTRSSARPWKPAR